MAKPLTELQMRVLRAVQSGGAVPTSAARPKRVMAALQRRRLVWASGRGAAAGRRMRTLWEITYDGADAIRRDDAEIINAIDNTED